RPVPHRIPRQNLARQSRPQAAAEPLRRVATTAARRIRRVTVISVKRLGHATLTTPDIDRQIAYYIEVVGLTLVERSKDRAYLACKMGLEAIALEPGRGNALSRLAFQVAPDADLADVARALAKDGVKAERPSVLSPGGAGAVVFTDPKGTKIEIFSDYAFAEDDGRTAGIMPLKLGHV